MRVRIDQDECVSTGRCLADAPTVFRFDEDELGEVIAGHETDLEETVAALSGHLRAAFEVDGLALREFLELERLTLPGRPGAGGRDARRARQGGPHEGREARPPQEGRRRALAARRAPAERGES